VNVVQPVEQLLHDLLDFSQTELDVDVRQEPGKIMFAEVEYEIEDRFVFVVLICLRPADFYQIHDIFVFEKLKDANFSERCDRKLQQIL
jgi:hypothetical protein